MLEEEQEELDFLKERYALVFERISEIRTEESVSAPFLDYFQKVSDFLLMVAGVRVCPEEGHCQTGEPIWQKGADRYQMEQVSGLWHARLYEGILPENYEKSYGNPVYAVRMLGDTYGRILSALYAMLRGMLVYVQEKRFEEQVILAELFVQVYTCFTCEELPTYRELQQIIYWFCSDYSELIVDRLVQKTAEGGLHSEDGKMSRSSVISQFAEASMSLMGVAADAEDAAAVINPQFVRDHCEDAAIVLDKRFLERRLGAVRVACEDYANPANPSNHAQERNGVENAAEGGFTAVPDVQLSPAAYQSHCVTKDRNDSEVSDAQPAAYRYSQSQRSLLDKAKEEITQIAEQFQ